MAKGGRQSRYSPRKSAPSSLVVIALLIILFSITVIFIGIRTISLPSSKSHLRHNLTSHLDTTAHRGGINRERGHQWIELISWEPRAFVYHNFLSKEECEFLIETAKPNMEQATVIDDNTGKSVDSEVRTSSGAFLERGQDEIIADIEQRIADWTLIPADHGEELQVLHYQVGQKYEPHVDFFTDELHIKNSDQRIATVLMYLSDVEEGGETVFPLAKGNHSAVPYWDKLSECGKLGLSVKPKMGNALLFWSMNADLSLDPLSAHGSCPVIRGNKWSCTKWMRANLYTT